MTENELPREQGEQPGALSPDPGMEEAAEATAAALDAVGETVEAANEAVADAADAAKEAMDAAGEAAGEAADAVEDAVADATDAVEERMEAADEAVADAARTTEAPAVERTRAPRQPLMDRLTEDTRFDGEATDDDRLMASLAYVSQMFIPLILPIIILISETSKKRPFQRYHAVQSLAVGLVVWTLELVMLVLLGTIGILFCCVLLPAMIVLWLLPLYYGILAHQGKRFNIPGLTQFLADQGWLQ